MAWTKQQAITSEGGGETPYWLSDTGEISWTEPAGPVGWTGGQREALTRLWGTTDQNQQRMTDEQMLAAIAGSGYRNVEDAMKYADTAHNPFTQYWEQSKSGNFGDDLIAAAPGILAILGAAGAGGAFSGLLSGGSAAAEAAALDTLGVGLPTEVGAGGIGFNLGGGAGLTNAVYDAAMQTAIDAGQVGAPSLLNPPAASSAPTPPINEPLDPYPLTPEGNALPPVTPEQMPPNWNPTLPPTAPTQAPPPVIPEQAPAPVTDATISPNAPKGIVEWLKSQNPMQLAGLGLTAISALDKLKEKIGDNEDVYKPSPIDQNIVNKYGSINTTPGQGVGGMPNYQGFQTIGAPTGLLATRLDKIKRGLL